MLPLSSIEKDFKHRYMKIKISPSSLIRCIENKAFPQLVCQHLIPDPYDLLTQEEALWDRLRPLVKFPTQHRAEKDAVSAGRQV